jgi:uncharacterized protein (DUF58 family)
MSTAPIVDRELLEKLERLTIHWHKSFRGLVGGHNPSRYSGPGQEFLDHRNFHHGDDLRAVNWRAYMRLEKLFLKMFQVEPRTPIRLLLDASASMGAPTAGASTKFDYARKLAAALTYIGLVRHDSITLQPFHRKLDDPFLASGGRHRFGPVADFLTAITPAGGTDLVELSRQFINSYNRPGLLVIISDFLSDGDECRPLQYLADFGHELLLIHLFTEEDRWPGFEGDLLLQDAESDTRLEISLDAAARAAYTAAYDTYIEQVEQLAWRNGGRFVSFPTSTPLEDAILAAIRTSEAGSAA